MIRKMKMDVCHLSMRQQRYDFSTLRTQYNRKTVTSLLSCIKG
ncbi:hypothetical protein GCM10008986_15320 [Salinibacillus aidingensis]|uniref:Uncharacterized protein n=1 Tax=Salinibacillus aidingensis TaxID=237684 RepID=A0ABN1B4W5_9BACI